MPTVVSFETLTEMFLKLSEKYQDTDKTAFARKPSHDAPYETIGWDKVKADVEILAAYLVKQGIEAGERVALLSENRYEWAIVDLATQLIGAVNVSLYTSMPAAQCQYILENSGASIFFVSTGIQLKKARQVFKKCPKLRQVIAFNEPKIERYLQDDYVALFEQSMAKGLKCFPEVEKEINRRAQAIRPDDIATLIYTSGTTGKPKGAMLTHHNIASNVKAAHQLITITDEDRCLSFLPLCHAFERTAGYYAMMAAGAEIYYAESIDTVASNMTEAHPTVLISVPRPFEQIYGLVKKSVEEGTAIKQRIFEWAQSVGKRYSNGERGMVSLQKMVADKLVFNKLKERTGGQIRFFVSGGAALPPKIAEFFMAAGLHILEEYGLTETSPVICANTYQEERIGTVGKILPGITVALKRLGDGEIIADLSGENYPTQKSSNQGEILCKGPNIMKGYWKNGKATKEAIDDEGYFYTGDIGKFVDGRLQITDRIKHMIVNAGGKNVYPGPIEDLFKTSKWIDQLMVVGEKQPYMAALIAPDFEILETYARAEHIGYKSWEELIRKEEVQNIYRREVRNNAGELASHEKIRDFRLIPDELTVETDELTPTLKVKRRVVEDKYGYLINDIFED